MGIIAKSASRADGADLAEYLTSEKQHPGERIAVIGSRGVTSADPHEALAEIEGMCAGWSGRAPICHAIISPERELLDAEWENAWALYEKEMGLEGQPYIEVEHHKGTRAPHRHRAYSRVDAETQRANSDSFSKMREEKVSRVIEYELGLGFTAVSDKHRTSVLKHLRQERRNDVAEWVESNGSIHRAADGRAHTFADCQQSKRTGIDQQAVRNDMATAWNAGDSGRAIAAVLESKGYVLARGDRLDVVLVDTAGGVHSPARLLRSAGIDAKRKAVNARLADLADLPTVEQAQAMQRWHRTERPTGEEIAAAKAQRVAEGLHRREERRRAWVAEQERADARQSLWADYQTNRKALRAQVSEQRSREWQEEQWRRKQEWSQLRSASRLTRAFIYLVTHKGLLRTIALALHDKSLIRKRQYARERQRARWDAIRAERPRLPSWTDFLNQRVAAGDPLARLAIQLRRNSHSTSKQSPHPSRDARSPSAGATGDAATRPVTSGNRGAGLHVKPSAAHTNARAETDLRGDRRPVSRYTADQLMRRRAEALAVPHLALPGLDTRALPPDVKSQLKAEYGLRWNRKAKTWEIPEGHPKVVDARRQWDTARLQAEIIAKIRAERQQRDQAAAIERQRTEVEMPKVPAPQQLCPPQSNFQRPRAIRAAEHTYRSLPGLTTMDRATLRESLVLTLGAGRAARSASDRHDYGWGEYAVKAEIERRGRSLSRVDSYRDALADYRAAVAADISEQGLARLRSSMLSAFAKMGAEDRSQLTKEEQPPFEQKAPRQSTANKGIGGRR